MMKILLVVTKAELGGAQKRIIDLAEHYQAAGHSVAVASGPGAYLPEELDKRNIEHIRFAHLSRDNVLEILKYMLELWRFLRAREFDVVHLNSSSALAGALPAKLVRPAPKTVFTFRGLSMLAPGFRANWLQKLFYRLSYKIFIPFVDVGVFQCTENRRTAHRAGIVPKSERIIRDGINLERIDFLPRRGARKELSRMAGVDLAGKRVVGSIGRLSYQKHYAFLLYQMRKLQKYREDTVCIIIGDGPQRAKLQKLIYELRLEESVFLVGKQKAAAKFIPGFDVFTLSSRYEGLSMTLTEAMHAGVPLLVSDVGCGRSTVGDDRLVFRPGDAVDFIGKLRHLLDMDEDQKEVISHAIHKRAEKLVLDRSADKYLKLYQGTVSES